MSEKRGDSRTTTEGRPKRGAGALSGGRLRLALAAAASVAFLYLTFGDASARGIVRSLAPARPLPIAAAVGLVVLTSLLRGWRWQVLLAPIRRIGFGLPHDVCAIGFLANNILPARAGEVVRADLLGRMAGINRAQVLATVLLERICDLVGLILMLAVVPWLAPQAIGGLSRGGGLLLSLGAVLLLALALAGGRRLLASARVRRRVETMGGFPGRLLQGLAEGFRIGATPGVVALAVAQTLGVWCLVGAPFHAIALAYDLPLAGPVWGLPSALAISAITGLGSLIPSLPGQVGTFHFFAKQGLELVIEAGVEIDAVRADTYTIAAHGLQYLAVNAVGLIACAHRGLRIGRPWEWLRVGG